MFQLSGLLEFREIPHGRKTVGGNISVEANSLLPSLDPTLPTPLQEREWIDALLPFYKYSSSRETTLSSSTFRNEMEEALTPILLRTF